MAVKTSELPAKQHARTDTERRKVRLARLRVLTSGKRADDVCAALTTEWEQGLRPDRIYVRRQFARLDRPLTGAFSDRKLPPRKLRPPSTRLVVPQGIALETYLTVLFIAQCHVARGLKPHSSRRVMARDSGGGGPQPWSDLITAPAVHRPGTSTFYDAEDNRIRQIKSALTRLADDEIRLVTFPNADAKSGKFEGFRPLIESGLLGRASRVPYTVPHDGEDTFSIPCEFFTSGWHMALTPSETALLLALWARSGTSLPWRTGVLITLDGETRIRQYGLSPDAYASHKYLDAFGVLEVVPDDGRRSDGTYEDFADGAAPVPHKFRIHEEGFAKPAVATVMATVKGMH